MELNIRSLPFGSGRQKSTSAATVSRKPGRAAGLIGAALAVALGSAVLVMTPESPAYAYDSQRSYAFDDPAGADWIVPNGVKQVWVGIRGGTGGVAKGYSSCSPGGLGDQFSVLLDVRKGDVITTYAGHEATGHGDHRIGGKGFRNGGDGGKGSLSAQNAGGGGGAAAVKLNGTLIAVAGGGGGCGGASVLVGNKKLQRNLGGSGGTVADSKSGNGSPGASVALGLGRYPGHGGAMGQDNPKSPGWNKNGLAGDGGTFASGGGGGGGGGGGYPSSGSGGGGGHKFAGSSGGGGGGAGMSWVKSGVHYEQFEHDGQKGPLHTVPAASFNKTSITVPLNTTTTVREQEKTWTGETPVIEIFNAATDAPNVPLQGSLEVYIDGVLLHPNDPKDPSRTSFPTYGRKIIDLPGLTAGQHTVEVIFTPLTSQNDWHQTVSKHTVVVTAEAPPAPIPDDPIKLDTVLNLQVPSGMKYGDQEYLSLDLSHVNQSGSLLGVGTVSVELDGESIGEFSVTSNAEKFNASIPLSNRLSAGTHYVSAEFSGSDLSDATRISDVSFEVGVATTTTTLNAPFSYIYGNRVQAYAVVASNVTNLSGEVELLANDVVITSAAVSPAGQVTFPQVAVPVGTTQLTARYTGDADKNVGYSVSDPSPFEVMNAETQTTLTLAQSEVDYDAEVTFAVGVTNLDSLVDPRGDVEILFDDEVVSTITVADDTDPLSNNAKIVYELSASHILVGSHEVSARFVPAEGFEPSVSEPSQALIVKGIETQSEAEFAQESSSSDPVISVNVTGIRSDPQGGFVEVFVPQGKVQATQSAGADPAAEALLATDLADLLPAPQGYERFGEPIVLESNSGSFALSALPAGEYDVLLRFTPDAAGHLYSTTTVSVAVAEPDPAPEPLVPPGPGAGGDADSGSGTGKAPIVDADKAAEATLAQRLSETGESGANALVIAGGAVVLLLAAAVLLLLRRRGKRTDRRELSSAGE